MRITMASRGQQSSPAAVLVCRGLERSESFGSSLRLCGSPRPPRRSCSASCYLKRPEREPFRPSKVELLEPSILGIQPEAPSWPAREDLMRDWITRRANCVELPLSLRIIKEKKKRKKSKNNNNMEREEGEEMDSMAKAFSCTVQVIRELQNHALRLRALALEEAAVDKMQSEMDSCFVWLFREVFSRTPDLMANVMLLTVDFAAHSLEKQLVKEEDEKVGGLKMSSSEKKLWDSMVEEAVGLNHGEEGKQQFVSRVRAEIQGDDDYEEYSRTDLVYQIWVDQDPNNSLLLCNYAQFLYLVTHNNDRAEECFSRAVQVEPEDGEALSQYATFLWVVRKDNWGAEERYQQAMAAEPDNPYHASNYANFLWTTGGDDTCFPL